MLATSDIQLTRALISGRSYGEIFAAFYFHAYVLQMMTKHICIGMQKLGICALKKG